MKQSRLLDDIRQLVDELDELKGENRELRQHKLDATKFYAATLTVEAVASLHRVHPDTVRKYVNLNLIEKHPESSDKKILIRASDALLIDFKDIKHKSHYSL